MLLSGPTASQTATAVCRPARNNSLPLVPAAPSPPEFLSPLHGNIKRRQLSVLGRVPLCREPNVTHHIKRMHPTALLMLAL